MNASRRSKTILLASLVLSFLLVGQRSAPGAPQDHRMWQDLLQKASFGLTEAVDRGLKEAKTGTVFHAELELDKGKLVYSIDFAQGSETFNVVLDAATGKLVETERESDDMSALVAACKLDVKGAVEQALADKPWSAIEAHLVMKKDRPVWKVRVVTVKAVESLEIDASTGVSTVTTSNEAPYSTEFIVERDELAATGRNPFFILEPGHELVLEGKEGDDEVRLVITVLDQTRVVDGVTTRVVEEHESKNGELVEISRNYFAISKRTNDVYYFGEEVDIYKDGKIASHDGAWLSGVDGARFGLIMPGSPLLGSRYYQEVAPGVAMDRAEVVGVTETFETPAGRFEGCLKTKESTPLESGSEHKIYGRGVGLLKDADLKLVRHGKRR